METLRRYSFNILLGLILTALVCGVASAARRAAKPDTGKATPESLAKDTAKEKKHGIVLIPIKKKRYR